MNGFFAARPGLRNLGFILLVFCWLGITAWYRPFTSPDEGRYAGVAYAMIHSGDWVVPRLNGLPFFHKPPLFYWISAAAMSLLGPSEWAARLPSMLGGTLAAASLFFLLSRRWPASSASHAGTAVIVLVTMPFFFLGAQFANLDMLVAGCISATIVAAADAALALDAGQRWRASLAGAYLFAALGLLAKGLIALVLPAMVFAAWSVITRRPRVLRFAAWWPGWLILLGLSGPWFAAMQYRYPEFFDYFVITQHFRRFASSGFNNEHPFWFYLPVIAGLTLPWFAWLLPRAGPKSWARVAAGLGDVDWLMAIWLFVIVVFFSLPRSKLIGYVLPALAPLAFLIARAVLYAVPEQRTMRARAAAWTAVASAAVCLAGVVFAARFGTPPDATLRLPPGESIESTDGVVMLGGYFYELPFYWRLERPVVVASDWGAAAIRERDNWQKELADAARFDPARAAELLKRIEAVPAAACRSRRTWIVAPSNALLVAPWLSQARLVTLDRRIAVWRYDGGMTRPCMRGAALPGGMPSDGANG